MADDGPIYTTVAFRSADKAEWKEFWAKLSAEYRFADDEAGAPTIAFAVSMGDMFRHQEIIEALLGSDMGPGEIVDAIAETFSRGDPETVLADWEVADPRTAALEALNAETNEMVALSQGRLA